MPADGRWDLTRHTHTHTHKRNSPTSRLETNPIRKDQTPERNDIHQLLHNHHRDNIHGLLSGHTEERKISPHCTAGHQITTPPPFHSQSGQ